MRVLFCIGYQKESINKEYWLENGLGGSEYCVIKLAEEFASNEHEVIVSGDVNSGVESNVSYINYSDLEENQHFDVVIGSNYIHYLPLLDDLGITYDKSYFWIHNNEFYPWYNGESLPNSGLDYLNDNRITNFIAVSEYQKNILCDTYNITPTRVKVLGNAISPSDFDVIDQEKYKNKVIYTSAADRGLENLLEIWPKLKSINSELTLWIASPPYAMEWYDDYKKELEDVNWLGNLSPSDLYTQIKSSEYWIYPSQYDETYCITALEMMMGRVKVISSDTGNLVSLLGGRSTLVDSNLPTSAMNEAIVSSYLFLNDRDDISSKFLDIAEEFARNQNWQNRYNEWVGMIESSNRLHPELYTYYENSEEWVKKFVSYSIRTKEWELIVDEPFDNCFNFPLFTPEFCRMIREEAEHSNAWTVDRHDNYPTTDMVLQTIGMHDIYMEILREYVMPLGVYMWALEGPGWDNLTSENFLAKYTPNAQGHLSIHHDKSDITCLVQLSDLDEYEGGGTWFRRQKQLVKTPIGYASLHPGNITHKHGARATTDGTRYIIVSFMNNLER